MIKLVCPDCRRENEPERIYCHDCGARLDRSALAKEPPKQEKPDEAHKRLRSMFDPQRDKLRRNFFKASKVILAALATAAVIQMILPPDVPEQKKSAGFSAPIGLDLENAATAHGTTPLRYTEDQANAYLLYTLKNKQKTLSNWTQFERAVVRFEENSVAVTIERSLYGLSFFTGGQYRVALRNGAVVADVIGGSIGRLPVHPSLMKFAGFLFNDVAAALDRETRSLAKLSGIEFQPQAVVITPRA